MKVRVVLVLLILVSLICSFARLQTYRHSARCCPQPACQTPLKFVKLDTDELYVHYWCESCQHEYVIPDQGYHFSHLVDTALDYVSSNE